MSMTIQKFDLINNTVDNLIHLLIHNNPKYFDDFNIDNDDFFIEFDETIIYDIRELVFDKLKKVDETTSIYSIIDNTLDYLLESDKAQFIKHLRFRVKKLYKFTESDSTPLYSYQY